MTAVLLWNLVGNPARSAVRAGTFLCILLPALVCHHISVWGPSRDCLIDCCIAAGGGGAAILWLLPRREAQLRARFARERMIKAR